MKLSTEQILKYQERIGLTSQLQADLDTLCQLQYQHLRHIPFENLNIHYQRPIVLDIPQLYQKIIEEHRGGFCYELNGLFACLLRALGYTTTLISARTSNETGTFGAEFDHLAILVHLADTWLVDVGFGRFSIKPLCLEIDTVQHDGRQNYQIIQHNSDYLGVNNLDNNNSVSEYIFTTQARIMEEFEAMCTYHQRSPKSHFAKMKMCSILSPEGRISLTSKQFIITRQEGREKKPIKNEAEFEYLLHQYFGIRMT